MKRLYASTMARIVGIIVQSWKCIRNSVNMVKLTNYLCWFMNVIVVDVNLPTDLICTSTLHDPHTVEQK